MHVCYYDKRPGKKHVHWEKYSSIPGLIILIIGFSLLAFEILLFFSKSITKNVQSICWRRRDYTEINSD